MTPVDAEKLLEKYWRLIRDQRPKAIVQSSRILPKETGTIKYAHFVYGEHAIQSAKMTDDLFKVLMESYGLLESYFVDRPDPINESYREYIAGLERGVVTDFRLPNPFGEPNAVNEYYNFVGQCFHDVGARGALTGEVLGAFVYQAMSDKWRAEGNCRELLELAGTPITRAIKLE